MDVAFKTIVAPTDFSPFSEEALHYARSLAGKFNAVIHLVHALERPQDVPWWVAEREYSVSQANVAEQAKERLTGIVSRLLPGVTVEPHVRVGSPSEEIVKTARDSHADLIVIATHGRGGLSRVLFGSVTERVVRHAPCPVLTVRPEKSKVQQ
jgi:nucleotide-binding universal stress UspA family protein